MAALLAGLRSLDERRRRWLATRGTPAMDGGDESIMSHLHSHSIGRRPHEPLLTTLIARQPWKLWLAGLLLLGIAGLVVALAATVPKLDERWRTPLMQFFSAERPTVAFWLSTLLLMGTAQLAGIIGWCRFRSQIDFDGRYRIWPWGALACLLWSLDLNTGAHHLLGDALAPFLNMRPLLAHCLGWLLPVSAVAVPLGLSLDSDMRGCWSSRLILRSTFLMLLAAVALRLARVAAVPVPNAPLWELGLQLAVHVGVFFALLLHAGYVLHHSADPPKRDSERKRVPLFGWLTRRRARTAASSDENSDVDSVDADSEETPRPRSRRSRKTSTTRRKKPTRTRKATVAGEAESSEPIDDEASSEVEETGSESDSDESWTEASSVEESDESTSSEPVASDDSNSSASDNSTDHRLDPPHGTDPFKGLSKRQRRELRKQQRAHRQS